MKITGRAELGERGNQGRASQMPRALGRLPCWHRPWQAGITCMERLELFSEGCGVRRGLQGGDLWTMQLYSMSVKNTRMYTFLFVGNKDNLKGTQHFVIHAY